MAVKWHDKRNVCTVTIVYTNMMQETGKIDMKARVKIESWHQ
jgi:hypothetical protein